MLKTTAYSNLAAPRTFLQRLLACLNFTLDSEDLFCWCKGKTWFLWTVAAAKAAESHGDGWVLAWYLLWGIDTSVPTWTHTQNLLALISSRRTDFKYILTWNIFQMITKTIPISTRRVVKSYAIKRDILFSVYKSMETDTTTWSEFPYGRKAVEEQILASEERNKSKRAGLW